NVVVWIHPADDIFATGSFWDTGKVPTPNQTAEIELLPGLTDLTVTITQSTTVGGLIIGTGVTLDILPGALLTVLHGIQNAGTMVPGFRTSVPVFLTGSGTVTGGAADPILITAAQTGATFVNSGNTIVGTGTIGTGDGALTFINQAGIIDATPLAEGD